MRQVLRAFPMVLAVLLILFLALPGAGHSLAASLFDASRDVKVCWGDLTAVASPYFAIGIKTTEAQDILLSNGFNITWAGPIASKSGGRGDYVIHAERTRSMWNTLSYFVAAQFESGQLVSISAELKCARW